MYSSSNTTATATEESLRREIRHLKLNNTRMAHQLDHALTLVVELRSENHKLTETLEQAAVAIRSCDESRRRSDIMIANICGMWENAARIIQPNDAPNDAVVTEIDT